MPIPDQEEYIHTIELNNSTEANKLPILVLLHGFGAGGCIFYRILKDLSQYYHIYCMDILG
jgi:pimeloyl-ACP methyl ester carboxylesterase